MLSVTEKMQAVIDQRLVLNCGVPAVVAGITLAISVGTTIAGAAMSAEAEGKAARAQAGQKLREAEAAEERKRYLERARLQELDVGAQQAAAYELRARRVGEQATAMTGLDPVRAQRAALNAQYMAALDARNARSDAARKAWGIGLEQQNLTRTAESARIQAGEIDSASVLGQTGIWLGAGGSAASQIGSYGSRFKYSQGKLTWQ